MRSDKKSPKKSRKSYKAKRVHAIGGLPEISPLEPRILWSATEMVGPAYPAAGIPHAALSVSAKATLTVSAPTSLNATIATNNTVQLSWIGTSTASGYYVLRSANGGRFSQIASIGSASASGYTDAAVAPGNSYSYKVEAYGGGKTSAASNTASVALPSTTTTIVTPSAPAAPSGLVASAAGAWVSLTWVDSDPSATGYSLLRSTDGVNFSPLAQVSSGSATGYTDTSVSGGQVYYYEVEAVNGVGTSAASNVASITAPVPATTGGVVIATRYGDELVITASGPNDSIALTESGSTVVILADQQSYTEAVPAAGVFVYTRGGSDGISIDASVTVRTTVETIDGAPTAISSAGPNVSAWVDATDTFSGAGTVHRISSFAGGVSKAAGASLPDPTDSGSVTQVNLSLFGTGPVESDVNQGASSDCYFLSSLAAFANEKPSVLTETAVDMGDGTYVVQFHSGSTLTFVRVSNDLSTGPYAGFEYAHPGANSTIWAMVMEKAFAYFRSGANTYVSLNGGWMAEVYSDFGVISSNFVPSNYSETAFYNMVAADLANGDAVTLGTSGSAPNLVTNHAYTLVSVTIVNGVTEYVVRNPWGFSGDAAENGQGYATLTFAQITANFFEGTQAVG